ncbi:hypothetical protein Ac2012v2_007701 [Leucoagaricus gongylophorus]
MHSINFLIFICFIASLVTARLSNGPYVIRHPSGGVVVSEGDNFTPIRALKGAPWDEGVWHLHYPDAENTFEPQYKILYRETNLVAGTKGISGSTVYTKDEPSTPVLFHIELYKNNLYQIAFDKYNVLVWTLLSNGTVVLELNEGSDNQMWKITASN